VGDTVCEWVLKQPRPEMIIVDDLSKDPRQAAGSQPPRPRAALAACLAVV
jgi:hypothetical protein